MFAERDDYLYYATIDKEYLWYAQTTGIYQCYCLDQLPGALSFYKIWTEPAAQICDRYVLLGMGGTLVSMPCGVTNSIMTNVGAILITKLIKKVKFFSRHN
jgi:hypothetical protein